MIMGTMRKPAFLLPRGACDTHVHIWGPFDRFPIAKGAPYTPPERTSDDLLALHARLGVDRAVIVQTTVYKADNRAMLDGIAWSNGRWRGVALIDESFDDTAFRALHEGGVRGVRFGFVKHLGGVPDLALVRRVPVRDGLDQTPFRLLLELLKRPNWWVKVSGAERISETGPPFADAIPFAQRLIAAAPDRVLWGTDWPHPNVRWEPDEADLVDLLPRFADAAALQQLLVDNPARLYGFS